MTIDKITTQAFQTGMLPSHQIAYIDELLLQGSLDEASLAALDHLLRAIATGQVRALPAQRSPLEPACV